MPKSPNQLRQDNVEQAQPEPALPPIAPPQPRFPRPTLPQPTPEREPTLEDRDKQAELALVSRYDALNQLFTHVEQFLKSLKPPHDVWVYYDHEYDGSMDVLGLAKHQDKWRLCHAFDHERNDDGPLSIQPVVECPVGIRIRASKQVRDLQAAIVRKKEEFIPLVDEAIQELTELCKEVASRRAVR